MSHVMQQLLKTEYSSTVKLVRTTINCKCKYSVQLPTQVSALSSHNAKFSMNLQVHNYHFRARLNCVKRSRHSQQTTLLVTFANVLLSQMPPFPTWCSITFKIWRHFVYVCSVRYVCILDRLHLALSWRLDVTFKASGAMLRPSTSTLGCCDKAVRKTKNSTDLRNSYYVTRRLADGNT